MTIHHRLVPGKYALRVEDYVMLAAAGAFADERTELIDGDVIVMAPEYRPHAYVRDELAYRLRRALESIGSTIFVGSGSIALTDNTMPQPDIVLTTEPRGEGAIPLRSIVLLLEVSSTTLPKDLGRKQEIYASAGVPEYWVVDIDARAIHQMSQPAGEHYLRQRRIPFGEPLRSATMPSLTIETDDL